MSQSQLLTWFGNGPEQATPAILQQMFAVAGNAQEMVPRLLPVLQDVVSESLVVDPLACLDKCWAGLIKRGYNAQVDWDMRLSNHFRESSGNSLGGNPLETCELIHGNIKALIATTALACCVRRKKADERQEAVKWLERASEVLNENEKKNAPPEQLGWVADINSLAPRFPASIYWTNWFLETAQNKPSPGKRAMNWVPIAVVTQENGEKKKGWISWFALERLSGERRLPIQHPETALQPFSADFLEPIEKLSPACNFPVVWNMRRPEAIRNVYFHGGSAGGAIARAIFHLSQKDIEIPDSGVLVLAKIKIRECAWQPGISPNWSAVELEHVDEIPTKKDAAFIHPGIQTIIEATQDGLDVWDKVANGWAKREVQDSTQHSVTNIAE